MLTRVRSLAATCMFGWGRRGVAARSVGGRGMRREASKEASNETGNETSNETSNETNNEHGGVWLW